MKTTTIACAAALALGVVAGARGDAPVTLDWPSHNGPADETAFSQIDRINPATIARLGLAWSLDLPDERMLEATPLEVGGVLYFTGSYSKVYAVEAASGKLLWTHDSEDWRQNPAKFRVMLPCNRGVAYEAGRVFVATLDGRLQALDAKHGSLLWSVRTVPLDNTQTITGAPRVLRGKVLIGNGGGDSGERGFLAAYDAATGREVWRFNVVPGSDAENRSDPAMARAVASWQGATPAGGAPWDSITVDPQMNRVYVGTGNPSPNDPEQRGSAGDALYTTSIVALDADTGRYIWHYQVNPRDAWDFDATQQMVLANIPVDGQPRRVLIQASKNGFLYVLDRDTGRLISAGKFGKVTWADRIDLASGRPVDNPNNRYAAGPVDIWPSALGAHSWQTMAYSPDTGLVYIPYMQLGVRYARGASSLYGGMSNTIVKADSADERGALIAWDPVSQQPRWTVQHRFIANGGALATGGGLVFQGTADGYLTAYDARAGRPLWRFNAQLGIIAAPIGYEIAGRQYVSVLVGYGATNIMGIMNAGWKYGAQPRRLLTFALDGRARLPRDAPQDFAAHAIDDPALRLDPADVRAGGVLFTQNCGGCHGLNAVSAGPPGPDLRASRIALSRDSLWAVVHDGALVQREMPPAPELTADQVREIHAYIRAMARQAIAEGGIDAH